MEELSFSTFGLLKASRNDVAAKMGAKRHLKSSWEASGAEKNRLGERRGLQKEILDEISAIKPTKGAGYGGMRGAGLS